MSKHPQDDNQPRLGHDPLEWLDDDESEYTPAVPPVTPAPVSSTKTLNDDAGISSPVSEEIPPGDPLITSQNEEPEQKGDFIADPFTPGPQLRIQQIESYHQAWATFLQQSPDEPIVLNCNELEDIDGAGLQLILSLLHSKSPGQVSLIKVSPHVQSTLNTAGIWPYISEFVQDA